MAGPERTRATMDRRQDLEVATFAEPAAFRDRTASHLLADEPRHNLLLAVGGILVDEPEVYPEFHLWAVLDGAEIVLAALLTPPFNVAISRPSADGAVPALVDAIHGAGLHPPGVTGAEPEVEAFAAAWSVLTGERARLHMAEGIYRLEAVRPVSGVPGGARQATAADRDLVLSWMLAFGEEALGDIDRERTERVLDLRFRSEDPRLSLWEDPEGRPVSLVGAGGRTPNGIRIGPVYTPREHRGRGYASALTAAVSAGQLERGRRFCFLYTDLSNPTSNALYRRIGYERVCDAANYRFEPQAATETG
jgi:ribosomal protein S18 acetylase RimI-like enzyme